MCISNTSQAGRPTIDEVTASSRAAGIAVLSLNRPSITHGIGTVYFPYKFSHKPFDIQVDTNLYSPTATVIRLN